jgi:DNA-binding HxlR family transcriptional regulator
MRIQARGHGREEVTDPPEDCSCGVCGTVELLGRKWTLDLVGALAREAPIRFNELERQLEGISPRTLSDRLSQLEEAGLVERVEHDQAPPKVEYRLEPKGRELAAALGPLVDWADEWA